MALLPKIGYGSSKREAGKYNRLFVYNMSEIEPVKAGVFFSASKIS